MPSVPLPETEDKLECQISGLKEDCSRLRNLVLTSHFKENFWNSYYLSKTQNNYLKIGLLWEMDAYKKCHYERVDYNVGMSGFLHWGDTPWFFSRKWPPPMSDHHYVIPCIFCGHLQLFKMTLRLLTTTVASVQLAIWASCKTDLFVCTHLPPPKKKFHGAIKIIWPVF